MNADIIAILSELPDEKGWWAGHDVNAAVAQVQRLVEERDQFAASNDVWKEQYRELGEQRDQLVAKLTHYLPRESTQMDIVLDLARLELETALAAHGQFASAHEAYAVLAEELDEFWEHVRKKRSERDPHAMQQEAIQIAAMGLKLALWCAEGARRR